MCVREFFYIAFAVVTPSEPFPLLFFSECREEGEGSGRGVFSSFS